MAELCRITTRRKTRLSNMTSPELRYPVSVKATFRIQGTKSTTEFTRTFDACNCEPADLGLPDGKSPVKPNAGDYTYSGMSDHGPLPVPRRGGDIAVLIECVNQTKQCSDDFLTDVIKKETIARSSNQQTDMSRKKFKGHPNKAV